MGSNAYEDQLRETALAVLAGLHSAVQENAPDANSDTDALGTLPILLERVGDLQRLGETPPAWCAPYLAAFSEEQLAAALMLYLQTEVEAWPTPEQRVRVARVVERDEDLFGDDDFGFFVRRRDDLQSAMHAVVRLCLRRGRSPSQVEGFTTLSEALHAWDTEVSRVLDQTDASLLLEERIALASRASWFTQLPMSLDNERDEDPASAADRAFLRQIPADIGEPDDAAVHTYLSTGQLASFVEGYAARSAEFAQSLRQTIETLWELNELGTALAPRRWLKQQTARADAMEPIHYAVPPLRLVAADLEQAQNEAVSEIDLGAITGLAVAVNASLRLVDSQIVLCVDADGPLESVRIGDSISQAEHAEQYWEARCPRSSSPLVIRFEDRAGRVFEEQLALQPES